MRVTIAALALLSAGCDGRPDQWDAFVYPNKNNLLEYEAYRGFRTFELCQSAALTRLRATGDADKGDYECGYRCEAPMYPDGASVCEQTRK